MAEDEGEDSEGRRSINIFEGTSMLPTTCGREEREEEMGGEGREGVDSVIQTATFQQYNSTN